MYVVERYGSIHGKDYQKCSWTGGKQEGFCEKLICMVCKQYI